MAYKTEKTAPKISVGADKEQPSQKCTVNIITENSANFNGFEKRNGYTHRIISILAGCRVPFSKDGTAGELSADNGATLHTPSESPRHLYSRSAESVIVGYTL